MSSLSEFPAHESQRAAGFVIQRTTGFDYSGFVRGIPLFGLAIAGFALNRGVPDRGIFIAAAVVAFLLLIVYARVMSSRLKRETLSIDGDRLRYRGVLRYRTFEVRGGHAVDLAYSSFWQSGRRWLFLNDSGIVTLRLPVGTWPAADLTNLSRALGLQIEVVHEPMKLSKARRAYPGSFSRVAVHPFASGILLGLGLCIALVVCAAIVMAIAK